MSRKYSMDLRLKKAYQNYINRYKAKEALLKKHDLKMQDVMLTEYEYQAIRKSYVDSGVTTNINQTIVSEQAYKYSQAAAKQMKATAKKFNLRWKGESILSLRAATIDVSGINDWLNDLTDEEREEIFAELPADVKKTNQGYISWTVYGSK